MINPINGKRYTDKYFKTKKITEKIPIFNYEDELIEKFNNNDVLIIKSTTGSGKSIGTAPILLKALNYNKNILISQPRTVNIMSTAEFIADQLDVEVGKYVGFQSSLGHVEAEIKPLVHVVTTFFMTKLFTEADVSKDTFWGKLEEITGKRKKLNSYDIYILDEVHERKLDMDIFMSIMKIHYKLTKDKRRKLILLSATIDENKYVKYFEECATVGVMNIKTKIHPIHHIFVENKKSQEVIPVLDKMIDGSMKIKDNKTGITDTKTGDILVFCPLQKNINELLDHYKKKNIKHIFFGKISRSTSHTEREYITNSPEETYLPDGYTRRIIFSTPITETGITIDGIKFVIDTGKELQVKYDNHCDKNTMKITNVIKANVTQRCGRAGRRGPGVCVHLYSEETFNKMSDNIIPEVYTNKLHSLLLSAIYYTNTLTGAKNIIDNLVDPITPKVFYDTVNDLYYHGIIVENKISKLGIAVANLGMDYSYALLIIESFRFNLERLMVPIVALMLLSRNNIENVSPNNVFENKYGEPISFLYLFNLFRSDFVVKYEKTIKRSLYSLKSAGVYCNKELKKWCDKYSFNFDIFKKTLIKIFEISNNLDQKVAKIIIDRKYETKEILETIIKIFTKVFYRNRLAKLHKSTYVIKDKNETINIPNKGEFLGFVDIIYTKYKPLVSCIFNIDIS